jgi:uncharacterized protein
MMRLFALIVLVAGLALPVRAQQTPSPETMQAARELAAIVTGENLERLTAAMTAQIWPAIEQEMAGKVDAATLADMRQEFERTLTAFTAEIMKQAPTIYARHFTTQELRDLVAFYKSPTGRKALHEIPKVIADVRTLMAPRMQAFQSDLNAKLVAIMRAHGYKN